MAATPAGFQPGSPFRRPVGPWIGPGGQGATEIAGDTALSARDHEHLHSRSDEAYGIPLIRFREGVGSHSATGHSPVAPEH